MEGERKDHKYNRDDDDDESENAFEQIIQLRRDGFDQCGVGYDDIWRELTQTCLGLIGH